MSGLKVVTALRFAETFEWVFYGQLLHYNICIMKGCVVFYCCFVLMLLELTMHKVTIDMLHV